MRFFERAEVGRDIVRGLGEEVVEGEEEERGREGQSPEETVAGKDGAGESRYADIEDTGGEGLVWGYERLYPVFRHRVRNR